MSRLTRLVQRTVQAVGPLLLTFAAAPGVAAATVEVEMLDYRFVPAEVRIKAGDTVRWINREKRTSHSVLLVASGQESERLFPAEQWEKVFERSGRHHYRCGPHPEMQGVVDVE
ncbi:plastocyanin/azurin family copper-binding protein [Dechloromonas sp. ZY10]|uniref:plastocyanin/azurin family copper-binding protein n=1 Tax=Dechloromonas aquae TaxID=2664436 RepID=UPI003529AF0E